jgi:Flp pilus assembly protein TadD
VESRVVDALLALEHGELNGALEHLDAAVTADPNCAMAHYLIGTTLESRGEAEAAEQSFGRALVALDGQDPTALAPCGGGVTVEELVRVMAGILESYRAEGSA